MAERSLSQRITDSRRLYQNPYAYLDDFGGFSALTISGKHTKEERRRIEDSRRLLQDPYAYLDDSGGFSAAPVSGNRTSELPYPMPDEVLAAFAAFEKGIRKQEHHSITEIELVATDLQRRIWANRDVFWRGEVPLNPIDILDPDLALRLIGYDFQLDETLGQYFSDGKPVEIAGMIDNRCKQVRVSRQFAHQIRNFTAAHELGHALLHEARGLHRDRPLDGSALSRDPLELRADKFATYFLMPQKLLRTSFEARFATGRFALDEATAFALTRGNTFNLERDCRTLRDLSRILADAESYNGTRFTSLPRQFRVSTEAMAIRLEELGLVAF